MNKVRYVCNDRNIAIEAEDLPGIRRILITISVNNKPAWQFSYVATLDQESDKISELLDRKTAYACAKLVALPKDKAENLCDANKVMICLYAWQNLKEVRTWLGNTIWKRI